MLPGALDSETARQGNEGERERPKENELGGSCDRRPWLQLMCCALEVLLRGPVLQEQTHWEGDEVN